MNVKYLKELFSDSSKSMVGKLCRQNELLQKRNDLSEKQKFEIIKDFNRELVYQEFRTLLNHVRAYNNGQKFTKYNIYPSTHKKTV